MKRLQKIFLVFIAVLTAIPFHQSLATLPLRQPRAFRVIIDAGHGGRDPGALGPNSVEKEITLEIAKKVADIARSELPDVDVILTRTVDTFVALHQRAAIANENNADLFISIHCNSNPKTSFQGAETYVMGLHKSAENLEVAKTENAAILAEDNYFEQYGGFNPDADEDYIMLNMMQAANISQSIDFAQSVQNKLFEMAGLSNRGVKQAGFVVLYLTTMPGVLIETGFLSNADEENYLLQKTNQQKIAFSIVEAISEFKKATESTTLAAISTQNIIVPNEEQPSANRTYRLWFTSHNKPISTDDRKFRDLPEIWAFTDKNGYHFTFEKANTKEEISVKLNDHRESGKIKNRYLKNIRIIELEEDKIISVSDPD
ncbi:MAG: N-acetylmuramoyl-L-alanine amidase [Bacteroidales bacterium]|nr:N-acetylmuramoyl-L-alanine amidase [Bacteroidales bacterium]